MIEPGQLNKRFVRIPRRAERGNTKTLYDSFVSIADIEAIIDNPENQIIIGRRGTGKTHALYYLWRKVQENRQIGVYLDLRLLGSNGSLYADPTLPREQRIAHLAVDFLSALLNALVDMETDPKADKHFGPIAPLLDEFATAISRIYVAAEIEASEGNSDETESTKRKQLNVGVAVTKPQANFTASATGRTKKVETKTLKTRGTEKFTIHFSTVGNAIKQITDAAGVRLWLFVDEWTAIPEDLQPYLADVLRRIFFPVQQVTIVVTSIEHRSRFQLGAGSGYIGIEVGADCASSINLDDFMVAENNMAAATEFYETLIYNHARFVDLFEATPLRIENKEQLVKAAFKKNAFEELVRAAEGVPRDAINILALAALQAKNSIITTAHIRSAALKWFEQDKAQFLRQNREAEYLLGWIVDKVIGGNRARAFLVDFGLRNKLLDDLYDGRVLHVLKRSISAQDEPGQRYIAYKIDYGCFVQLLAGSRAPKGLLVSEDVVSKRAMYVHVPPDDFGQIKKSILNISEFNIHKFEERLRRVAGEAFESGTTWHFVVSQLMRPESPKGPTIIVRKRGGSDR